MRNDVKAIITGLILIVIIVICGSCDAAKRMQRICNNHPEVCRQDTTTIVVRDTFSTKQILTDTTFAADQADTVYLIKENLVIKYKYNPLTKQVYISGEVKPTTHVFIHKIQVVNKEVTFKKTWMDYLGFAISFLGGFVITLPLFNSILKRTFKKE